MPDKIIDIDASDRLERSRWDPKVLRHWAGCPQDKSMILLHYIKQNQNQYKSFRLLVMEEDLLTDVVIGEGHYQSFRDIRKGAVAFGTYQKRLFIMMGFYWITASFFLILPFYFFKLPIYCLNSQTDNPSTCISCQDRCAQQLCQAHPDDIKDYVLHEHTLTYGFGFFCGNDFWRIFYKIAMESMAFVGLILYGIMGDVKGRKLAFKISWRFYTIGLVFFTFTNTPFLVSFGYFIACINCFASLVIQFVLLFQQISPSIRLFACYLLLSFLLVAPLLTSFLSTFLVNLGRTWTLAILCTFPSIVLSFVTGFVEQSALFIYKSSKIHAFSILNSIAKINKCPPFIIDLSQSCWRKLNHYNPSIVDIFIHEQTRNKLLLGMFFSFGFQYCRRMAQIQLDPYTDQYIRGTMMNAASAIAILTVIILFTRFKLTNFRIVTCLLPVMILSQLVITVLGISSYLFETISTIAIRYFCDLSYSFFLIWAIETYPTVCRTKCVGMVLSGISVGSILTYALRLVPLAQLGVGLAISLMILWFSKYLRLDYDHRLMDTLEMKGYDRYDEFKRV